MITENHTKYSHPTSPETAIVRVGIVGAGGFAHFAAKAFQLIPQIKIIAVTDINEHAAITMAGDFKAIAYNNYEEFLMDGAIDLVYIATPPYLHYGQCKKALLSGKHVICEKPAALKTSEAEELQALAGSLQLLYVVNLMQRYNPLYGMVKKVIDSKLLGNFLHGYFENYASDENLSPHHWFWDEAKSGGIFIEHGVHFFDMFSGWLGKGKVLNAVQLQRPGNGKLTDRVQAAVLYNEGIVNFYHGFDQPTILDRQEMRLQFERGDITLYEWVPVKMTLQGLLKKEELQHLAQIMGKITFLQNDDSSEAKKATARGRQIMYDNHVTIEYGSKLEKQNRYRQILTSMLQDQLAWIKDRAHVRAIDANNAVESTRMAEEATQIARYINLTNA